MQQGKQRECERMNVRERDQPRGQHSSLIPLVTRAAAHAALARAVLLIRITRIGEGHSCITLGLGTTAGKPWLEFELLGSRGGGWAWPNFAKGPFTATWHLAGTSLSHVSLMQQLLVPFAYSCQLWYC